jgi:DNA-binding Lrp family transcriptional regulator
MPKSVTLDQFDRALLAQVQKDNQLPARRLAERVGLSESAVLRRLRRLRRDGVIIADVAIVHPAVLGLPLSVLVLVSLEREGPGLMDAFIRKARSRPEVRQAWYVTGDVDFVLHLQVADMEAYLTFAREMFHGDPNIKAFRTMISMREIVSLAAPGPAEAQAAPGGLATIRD